MSCIGIALQGDEFLDGVARGAGVGGDDGAVAAGEKIQQRGLADVGGTGNDDAGAFAQDMAFVPGVQQGLDFVGNGGQAAVNLFWNRLRQFIIRKIQHGLNVGGNGEQGVVQSADAQSEGVFELGGGEARGPLGTGMDEIQDGLGLRQVDFVVQKGSFGEFAGLRLARAGGQKGVEDALGGQRASVTLDFDGILAGVGVRSAENQQQGLIEHLPGGRIDDLTVEEGSGGARGGRGRGTAEKPVGEGIGLGAGQADNGNGAFARRGGDGGDGVGWIRESHVCRLIHRNGHRRNSGSGGEQPEAVQRKRRKRRKRSLANLGREEILGVRDSCRSRKTRRVRVRGLQQAVFLDDGHPQM